MSYLRTEHAPLYTLLACVLWDEKYRGRFVSFATAKSICDVMAPDDYITGKNSLSTALKCGDDAIDWPVFDSLSPEEKMAIEYADGTKLVIRKNLRCGKNRRANVVGCFGPDHAVPELRGSDQLMAFAAGGERSSVRGEYNIPSAVMDKYNEYARSRFNRINESLPSRARPRPKSANSSSAAAKRTRPNTADAPPAALDKEAEIVKLKEELDSVMLQRRQIDASIVATVSRLKALGDGGGDPTADRVEKMYYILGDCAGEIDVNTDRDVILLSELLDGLIIEDDETAGINGDNRNDGQEDELGAESDDEADDGSVNSTTVDHAGMDNTTTAVDGGTSAPPENSNAEPSQPKRRQYVYNKRYNCWVPKWVVAVNASDYGRLKKEAISVRAFKALFRRKKTRFPSKAKSIITASTIPAAGASDFGVQSVIFGTTKAIAEVMGINISHEQLSQAIPSVKTLRNWEFDLAGGCIASVIDQIANDAKRVKEETDKPLQISLITDHGNRDGMDHLVKMICWSSMDKHGNRILRHFNMDVDRGGHSYIEAANAISHSLRQLMLDDYDVEFSFITGDSGGGAKVQSLHPTLCRSETMTEWSDYINCLLHALNLAFQTACIDSLGDQGMNKLTVFQMLYLAILMLNTIKKQTDIETLKKYYSLTMTQVQP